MRNIVRIHRIIPTLLFALLCLAQSTQAQSNSGQERILTGEEAAQVHSGAEMVRYLHSSVPDFVRMRGDGVDAEQTDLLLRKMLKMREHDALVTLSTEQDELGYTHRRMRQTYHGMTVLGSMYIAHEQEGRLKMVNGVFRPGITAATAPLVSESVALEAALAHMGAKVYKWELPEEENFLRWESHQDDASFFPVGEAVIAPIGGDFDNGEYRLAWRFDVYAHEPLGRKYIYVDAINGNVLLDVDRIHTADVLGSAVTRYSGTVPMTADFTGSTYRLRETGRGNGIFTYDLNTGTNYASAVDFTDADNVWNNVNPQQDEVAGDAHWGAEKTYDYFLSRHGRNSIDGAGYNLISYVHYSSNYNNAFWDGTRMTYGDGNGSTFTPLTCIDVTGHEITHGLTTFTADLVYSYESGALNESFSDIFGNTIENWAKPTDWNWRIGEEITPSGNGIRSMQNPNLFGDPDTYMGTNYYTGTADNGGVHTNSGVQNKWYYILTVGETGTNDIGNAYNVTGQGWVKASSIAFRNLTVYLTTTSNHADARFFAIQSAIDLYGPCTNEVIATTNAWYAVGVGPAFTATVTASFTASPTLSCSAPTTVNFTNTSIGAGSFTWHFGDGATSTLASPSHTYTALGTYTVKLVADGGPCGKDSLTRTAYIDIDTANACVVSLSPTGINTTQYACSGTLHDTGGPTGNYLDNMNSAITIAPPGASSITLNFTAFNYELNYDYIRIYNGPSTSSPLLGSYTGTTLPGTIVTPGGVVTIQELTDPSVVASGFTMTWNCSYPTAPPVTNFTGSPTSTCNGTVFFTDASTGGPTSWLWNFGDGFTSTLQNPSHVYTANGTYTVSLTATNAIGSSTFTRTAYINISKPAGPGVSGTTTLCAGGTTTLNASGTGTKKWYTSSTGGAPVFVGNPFTTPTLSSSTVYYVENQVPATSQYVGPTTNGFGTGGNHNNSTPQYEIFTVSQPLTLVSVYVYPNGAGNRTIKIWDNAGVELWDTVISIPATAGRITLNKFLMPGSYRIGGSSMNLYRNNAGASYPYNLAGMCSITGSSAGSGFFYFFYNWEVKPMDCISLRTAVPITVNPAPTGSVTPSAPVICNGTPVAVTAGGGGTYTWSTGATTSTINLSAAGTYTVTVTSAAGCTDVETVNATASTVTGLITPATAVICNGAPVTLTASGGSTYLWSTGATTASINASAAGSYTVTVTNAAGCQDVKTRNVTSSTVTAGISSAGTVICNGAPLTLTATGGGTYAWSTGATTASIAPTTAGTYTVTVTNAAGCQDTEPITLTASTVSGVITPATAVICNSAPVTLTASGGSSYLWSTGATTASINASTVGSYTVTVTNAAGCQDVKTRSVTASTVTAGITSGGTVICNGAPVTLTGTGGGTYAWSTGATTASIAPTVAGTYTVTVTNAAGCTDTEPITLTASTVVAGITPSATNICNGAPVTLTGTGGSTYAWSSGASTSAINVTTAGTYTLTVTDGAGCADTEPITLTASTVVAGLTPSALHICNGAPVTLTGSGGSTYAWSTGASTSSINAATAGAYTVTVTDAFGCSDTESTSLTASTVTASITPSATNICNGAPVDLTGGGGSSYAWSTGSSSGTISVSSAGSYTVTATDGFGCSDTESYAVTSSTVTAGIAPSSLVICNSTPVLLTGSGGGTYAWSTGATTSTVSPSTAGTYTVTATDAFGCSDTESVTLTEETVTAVITPTSTVICNSDPVTLSAAGGGTYAWSTGEVTADITITLPGTYTVTVTGPSGCTDEETVVITSASAAASITPSSTVICNGDPVTLTGSGGGTYTWSEGSTTAAISVATAGTYTVTVTNGACTDTETVTVTASTVTAAFSVSSTLLTSSFTDLSTGATTWAWDFGDGTGSSSVANPTYTYGTDGTYTVTLIVTDASGCADTTTQTVTVISTSVNAGLGNNLVSIYPNPFMDELHFDLFLTSSSKVEITAVDALGRELITLWTGEVAGGEFHHTWQTPANLSEGIYVIRVKAGDMVVFKKFTHLSH
jgi:Zn-dependent metalloprotease